MVVRVGLLLAWGWGVSCSTASTASGPQERVRVTADAELTELADASGDGSDEVTSPPVMPAAPPAAPEDLHQSVKRTKLKDEVVGREG
jgi:hypothetical protein